MEQIPKLVKLQVQSIDNNRYSLFDGKNNLYKFTIYFYEVDCSNIKNISMSSELLNPNYYEYSDTYSFGPIGKVFGRKLTNNSIQDLIILETDTDKYYLQRYYG